MKKLVLFLFLLIATISKAQIGGGYDQAMNFGGAGTEVLTLKITNQNETYFVAKIMGRGVFAGQQLDGGAFGTYPIVKTIVGKISSTGTQTLIRDFGLSGLLKGEFTSDGDFYGLFAGNASTPVDFGNGVLLNNWGLYLIKFNNTGAAQFIKKVFIGNTDIQYGNSGIATPNIHGINISPDGNIYVGMTSANIDTGAPNATFKYPARIAKFNANGDEVWHNDLYSANWGSLSMPSQFVSNDGKVTFGIHSTSSQWYFNGQSIASEMSNYVNSAYSIVISLNADGTKNFTLSDVINLTLLQGVNPISGDLYVNYTSVNVSTFAGRPPYTTLPNLYPNSIAGTNYYLFAGTLIFNSAGNFTTFKLHKDFGPEKMFSTANGFVGYEKGFANAPVEKGDYVFNSSTAYGVVSFYDQDFNFLKAIKTPEVSTFNAVGNKMILGGAFKGNLTFGTTTLTQSFNDTDFATRFPSFASFKADIFIAKADAANINPPVATNWLGVDNNWNNTANWSTGLVPDAFTLVRFNNTTANMPTSATAPTALKVTIDAGVTAQLPAALVIKNKLIINGTLQINHTGTLNYTNYSATAIEGTGTLAFNGTGTSSVNAFSLTGFKDLSLSTNENITLTGIYKNITFTGTNAIITASAGLEITNPDVNAISGFSATNYIAGKITRAVNANGTYVFPNSQFSYLKSEPTTLTLNNLTGTTKITVANDNGPSAPNVNFATGTTTSVLGDYYWKITPNVAPTGGSYDVSFSKSVFSNGVTDPNRYVVLKRIATGNPWTFEGTKTASTQTGGTTSGQTVSNATVTAGLTGLNKFSDFVIGINSTPVATNTAVTTSTWTGNTNTAWNNTGNWSNGIPNATVDAVIPAGLTNYPLVYTATDNARSLTINSGITGLKLMATLKLTNGLINNSDIEIAKFTGGASFLGFGGGVSGSGKLRFESTGGITSSIAGIVNNDIEINVGNTNYFNLLGKFGGNINIISGLVNALSSLGNLLEQTNPNASFTTTSSINHISAERLIRSVNTSGTYSFPLGDFNFHTGGARKSGEMIIKNNNIAAPVSYTTWLRSGSTKEVSLTIGTDVINSFINTGQWSIDPTGFSTTGTIDLTLKAANYTNGRANVNDYVLLRLATSQTNTSDVWSIVSGATFSESGAVITVTANGLAPFSTNTTFCIGLKATTTTWTGNTSADWNIASNWSNGVPSSTVKAVIANASRYPSNAPNSGSAAAAIEIAAGSTLTLPSSFYTPNGIINNGTININGSGTFYGFGNYPYYSSISGSGKLVFGNGISTFESYWIGQIVNNSIEVNNPSGLTLPYSTTFTGNVTLTNGIVTMASGQTMIMNNPNATITGSATAYINGKLQRSVNASGTYNFPVGLTAVYAPTSLTLNNLVGTTNIIANFSNAAIGGQPNLTINGQTVSNILSGGSWFITPSAQPTSGSYTATLSAPIGSSTANNYYVLKRPDNYSFYPWINSGTNALSTITAGVVTASASGLTSFSQFGIGEGMGTLPVKIVKFLASADAKSANLYWETASELNNDKFIIERSDDSGIFTTIGEVKGNGNSTKLLDYNFKDYAPLQGNNYYRLKQIDFNGKFEYTEVKVVNFDLNDFAVSIYPNPANNYIQLSGLNFNSTKANIINMNGKIVFAGEIINNKLSFPATLENGFYIIQFTQQGQTFNKKIIIQH